jgi:hypothetical protein
MAPAREEVFPLHPHCRSSELCLEWEARLGRQLPFRQAEEAVGFFTHGATDVEDNTIARHLGVIGGLVDRRPCASALCLQLLEGAMGDEQWTSSSRPTTLHHRWCC